MRKIIIELGNDPDNEMIELINKIKEMTVCGHCLYVALDPDYKEDDPDYGSLRDRTFCLDGDGSFIINDISVIDFPNNMEEELKSKFNMNIDALIGEIVGKVKDLGVKAKAINKIKEETGMT